MCCVQNYPKRFSWLIFLGSLRCPTSPLPRPFDSRTFKIYVAPWFRACFNAVLQVQMRRTKKFLCGQRGRQGFHCTLSKFVRRPFGNGTAENAAFEEIHKAFISFSAHNSNAFRIQCTLINSRKVCTIKTLGETKNVLMKPCIEENKTAGTKHVKKCAEKMP